MTDYRTEILRALERALADGDLSPDHIEAARRLLVGPTPIDPPTPAPVPYYSDEFTTIYHAESLDVLPHLSGIGAIVTDPPYSSGGAFRGDRTKGTVEKYTNTSTVEYRPEFAGDTRDQRAFATWCTLWMNAARLACVDGAPICSFIDWRQLPTLTDSVQAAGWLWRGVAVWSKKYGRPQPGRFSNACEYVVWGSNGPMSTVDGEGADKLAYPAGVFECSAPRERVHVAQKPVEVMRWLLSIVRPGAIVLDPFMGSGATLRAARDLGLHAIGIDSDERYCEHAAEQLAQGSLFSYLDVGEPAGADQEEGATSWAK